MAAFGFPDVDKWAAVRLVTSSIGHSSKLYSCQCSEHDVNAAVAKVSRCFLCEKDYCEACWDRIDPHKGISSHERNEPELVDLFKNVLEATERTDEQERDLHQGDAQNLWFGIKEHDGMRYIYEGPSYEDLVFGNVAMQPWGMYPGLVTFVGDTGAGKSTLIKLLIDLVNRRDRHSTHRATPIVGNIRDESKSTSSDVHLYADPSSMIFYADCEGLGGGEQKPVASCFAQAGDDTSLLDDFNRFIPKPIKWAISGRQSVVQSLYPRLLYSFSDTIVFVLDNPRKIEQVVIELVNWGHQVVEKACNQSVLPHAIIVLNKSSTNSTDKVRWKKDATTEMLLDAAMAALETKDKLQEKVQFWEERKVTINTPEDLLKRYYASITAIRIPQKQPPSLVESQINELHSIIAEKCETSQKKRHEERMQLNAVDLHLYLRRAFEHFAAEEDEPFDFIKASFDINSSSASFGLAHGISVLAGIVQKCLGYPRCSDVWDCILPFIASCMCLSAYRLHVPGVDNSGGIFDHFWKDCADATLEFYDKKLRCEYRSDKIKACVNVKNAHRKGHQSVNGSIEGGDWVHSLSYNEFLNDIKIRMQKEVSNVGQKYRGIRSERDAEEDELCQAFRCHRSIARKLRVSLDKNIATFRSHFICLSCLMEAPEHTLPCGHTLCTLCVSAAGKSLGSGFFETESCPLESNEIVFPTPYRASVKPIQAGVRILTLDGGGVRGIVELEVLRAIELELGDEIPIQAFFDLIVGTSTGGIISLGLGHEGWKVKDCADKFRSLAGEAFKPHRLGWLSILQTGTKYRTDLFTGALGSAFTTVATLFGEVKAASALRTKTAVVAATPTGPVTLLSNYNRRVSENERYRFFRGADQSEEMKTYESARATSSAPWFWEVYCHGSSGQVYLDGGISHNNPIRIADSEQKSIWPERKYSHPDVLLSIGTGYPSTASAPDSSRNNAWWGPLATGKAGWNIGSKLLEERLNSERIWQDWIETRMPPPEHLSRYRRVNVPLNFEPKMDNFGEMEEYANLTKKYVKENCDVIRGIAHQLIASCFYFRFDKEKLRWEKKGWVCEGRIECRLPPGDSISRGLGEVLHKLSREIKGDKSTSINRSRGLCFCVTEMHLNGEDVHDLTQEVIDKLREFGHFKMAPVKITITSEAAETKIFIVLHAGEGGQIPISGFPRNLLKDYPETYRKRKLDAGNSKEPKEPLLKTFQNMFFNLMLDNTVSPLQLAVVPHWKHDERHARSKVKLRVEKVISSRPSSNVRDTEERSHTA